jgi:hypothetical protein
LLLTLVAGQVDVLDTQFSILLDKITASTDFEAVRLAHEDYLSALLTYATPLSVFLFSMLSSIPLITHAYLSSLTSVYRQCFLRSPVVARALDELLAQCTRFVQIVAAASDTEMIEDQRVLELTKAHNHPPLPIVFPSLMFCPCRSSNDKHPSCSRCLAA